MRGRPNAQRTILAIVDPGSGCRRTIPCDGSRRWPTWPWRVCRRRSTACTPRWVGPWYRPSGSRGFSADCPGLGAQRTGLLRGTGLQPAVPPVPGQGRGRARLRPGVFTKNRRRRPPPAVGQTLFDEVVGRAWQEALWSDEHFTVDGTLIEAAAGFKTFRRRDKEATPVAEDDDPGHPTVDFRREKRNHKTHASRTDPEARRLRKGRGKEAELAFLGHALMEYGKGLLMDFTVSPGHRHGRVECGSGVPGRGAGTGLPAAHTGRRPRLRHEGLCEGHPCAVDNPACDSEEESGHRRSHHAPCRLRGEHSPVNYRT